MMRFLAVLGDLTDVAAVFLGRARAGSSSPCYCRLDIGFTDLADLPEIEKCSGQIRWVSWLAEFGVFTS
jgi:hypothetical protein